MTGFTPARGFEFQLENHAQSMRHLRATMARVQTDLAPREFIGAIATAFQSAQAKPDLQHLALLQDEPAFQTFTETLHSALQDLPPRPSILLTGCGSGFAGLGAEFAAEVVQNLLPSATFQQLTLTPSLLSNEHVLFSEINALIAPFDLVVSYSLFHFLPTLAPAFSLIDQLVGHRGGFVMGHEPNAEYWLNTECQLAFRRFQLMRKPKQWVRAALSRWTPARPDAAAHLLAEVNANLRRRYDFKDQLTDFELRRIVDVHRPDTSGSGFKIGLDGFDVASLGAGYLSSFRLAHFSSSGHMGYNQPRTLSPYWRGVEQRLAVRHPRAGVVFSAYWKRQ